MKFDQVEFSIEVKDGRKPCANCGTLHKNKNAFCSPFCKELTEYIRMCRRWVRNADKQSDPNYAEVFYIRIGQINSFIAGHRKDINQIIPIAMRRMVFERDNGLCVLCGKPGTEIDHTNEVKELVGKSVLENLRLLCHECHSNKTFADMERSRKKGMTESETELVRVTHMLHIAPRVNSDIPLQISDDEQNWQNVWRNWPDTPDVKYSVIIANKGYADIGNEARQWGLKMRGEV